MNKRIGIIVCALLAACTTVEKKVIRGPTPGIEYRNQNIAPWPWVAVVPSERALALKQVDFEHISRQLHFDMSFEGHSKAFKDVRLVVLDYTILPHDVKENSDRPKRYFMVASFYKIGKRPPCPPDFEVTTSMRSDSIGVEEAMQYMARDLIEEIHTLYDDELLTPGRKITVNLDS